MWDEVGELWVYIVQMVQELKDVGRAELWFPDQPLDFLFEAITGRPLVRVTAWAPPQKNRKVVVTDADSLVNSLLTEAERVLRLLQELTPREAGMYDIFIRAITNYSKS